MSELHLHGTVRRVGNSLAILIPAKDARAANIEEGTEVDVDLRRSKEGLAGILGLLKDIPCTPFVRADEDEDDF